MHISDKMDFNDFTFNDTRMLDPRMFTQLVDINDSSLSLNETLELNNVCPDQANNASKIYHCFL